MNSSTLEENCVLLNYGYLLMVILNFRVTKICMSSLLITWGLLSNNSAENKEIFSMMAFQMVIWFVSCCKVWWRKPKNCTFSQLAIFVFLKLCTFSEESSCSDYKPFFAKKILLKGKIFFFLNFRHLFYDKCL